MSQSHAYRIEEGVAIIEVIGEQSFDDFIALVKRVYADPAYRDDMPRIYDTRRQTSFFDVGEMIRLRDALSRINAGRQMRRRLGVVALDAMVEKLVKLYRDVYDLKSDGGSLDIRFFTAFDDAMAWAKGGGASS